MNLLGFLTRPKEDVFPQTATRDAEQENAGAPVGGRQGNQDMLNVAEKAEVTSLKSVVSPHRKLALWLDDEVAKSALGVTTKVVDLTPELASVLLGRNEKNRKLSENTVVAYARDMANGAWRFNGEPVIISDDGKLNDGQHRCEAVIESGATVPVVMVFGVERHTRDTLDQGKARSAGDFLAMNGHMNTSQLGAAASFYWQYSTYGFLANASNHRPTKSEVLRTVEENPLLVKSVDFCKQKGVNAIGGPSLLGFCHYAIAKAAGRASADEFMQALIDGIGLSARNPILYTRNRLIVERGKTRGPGKSELIFRCWNAHRTKKFGRGFQIHGGPLPKLER